MNIQDLFPLGLTGLISLQSEGLSRVFNTTVQKHLFFSPQHSLWSNSHIHTWLLEKPCFWLDRPLLAKVSLFFNMLSRLVIAFLPRRKRLLISWLQSPSAVILEPKERKSVTVSIVFPPIWKDWCWSCSPNTLATWCEEPTHWKRPWCWERLSAKGEGDSRGWDS